MLGAKGHECETLSPHPLAHSEELHPPFVPPFDTPAQRLVLAVRQHGINGNDLQGLSPSQFDEIGILGKVGPPEIEPSSLSSADQLTHPPLLQIQLRDSKSIRGIRKAFQARVGAFIRRE